MDQILYKLENRQTRTSTSDNYLTVWRQFNQFLIRLDRIPSSWEDRVSLFCAHLIEDKEVQSSTLKSYISAIKHMLKLVHYEWKDERIWLHALVRSCKIKNDRVATRLPIQFDLLEELLFEIEREYPTQPYLKILFQAIFAISYYGLMCIGEVTDGKHVEKAKDIYIADNKDKIKIILYSSKTHSQESQPQEIKISAKESSGCKEKFFCPFQILRTYMNMRIDYVTDDEPYFIYRDRTPVQQTHVRCLLKKLLVKLGINPNLYNTQSMHIGRETDLLKFGFNVETIKRMGRWKSNAVYKYL